MPTTTVYRALDDKARLLYVGISDLPLVRLTQHGSSSALWPEYTTSMTFERFATRREARLTEIETVEFDDPVFNKADRSQERYRRWLIAYPDRHADDVTDDEYFALIDRIYREGHRDYEPFLLSIRTPEPTANYLAKWREHADAA